MSRFRESFPQERKQGRTWGDSALKLDPAFEQELRHVLYDRDVTCPRCDYNLSGADLDRCPECGVRLGDYLRIADTTPWRLEDARRLACARWAWDWLLKIVLGIAAGVALIVLAKHML